MVVDFGEGLDVDLGVVFGVGVHVLVVFDVGFVGI